MKKFKCLLLFLLLIIPFSVHADEKNINVYLFEGKGCPHCAAEKEFFEKYLKENKNVKLYEYEVWYNVDNQKLLQEVQEKLNNKESGVPYTVIGNKVIIGFSEYNTEDQIKNYINDAINDDNYKDYVGSIVGVNTEYNTDEKYIKKNNKSEMKKTNEKIKEDVEVPVLGKVNPKKISLPLLSVILGFVDGFNPCAMWILIFLITMLFNMKNRKRMWILGSVFILTSGVIYLAFMLTWLNLGTFISKLSFIRFLVSAVALIIGIWNIIKFSNSLSKKDEGCDVVDNKERKK